MRKTCPWSARKCRCTGHFVIMSTRLHHEAPADGVEGIRDHVGGGGGGLRDRPLGHEVGILLVLEDDALACVVEAEVGAPVHDDALQQSP